MPPAPRLEDGHAATQPYPTSDNSLLPRRSSRQSTPAKKAGGATQAEIHEVIEGGGSMEGVETTPPRRAIQEDSQTTEGSMMQVLFSMLARMEASIQEMKEGREEARRENMELKKDNRELKDQSAGSASNRSTRSYATTLKSGTTTKKSVVWSDLSPMSIDSRVLGPLARTRTRRTLHSISVTLKMRSA